MVVQLYRVGLWGQPKIDHHVQDMETMPIQHVAQPDMPACTRLSAGLLSTGLLGTGLLGASFYTCLTAGVGKRSGRKCRDGQDGKQWPEVSRIHDRIVPRLSLMSSRGSEAWADPGLDSGHLALHASFDVRYRMAGLVPFFLVTQHWTTGCKEHDSCGTRPMMQKVTLSAAGMLPIGIALPASA